MVGVIVGLLLVLENLVLETDNLDVFWGGFF